mgnify:CR=1 FL=1
MTLRNFIFKLQNIDTQIQGASSSKGWLADRELIFVPHDEDGDFVDSEVLNYTIEEDAVLIEVGRKIA